MRRLVGLGFVLTSLALVACSSDGSSDQSGGGKPTGGSGGTQGGSGGTGGAGTGGEGTGGGGTGGAGAAGASAGGAAGTGGQSGSAGSQKDAEALPESGGGMDATNSLDGSGQPKDGSGGSAGTMTPDALVDSGTSDASLPRTDAATRPARVLLYWFSTSEISGVSTQLATLKAKLEGWQYQVDESKDPADISDANLAKYAAVGMINTCFFPFGANQPGTAQSQALQKFLQAGGGLFGTHCAAVTFKSTNPPPLYNQLLGGRSGAGASEGSTTCTKSGDHPTITALPETFPYTGNLDMNDFLKSDTTVLVKCKALPSGPDIPVSWVRNEGAGRVFFTSFGKVDADLTNATIGDKHIIAGLGWVLGR